ncbi:hypothetical protein DFH07DRAFT_274704 [Mycena maculata]|uniref:Uncharacterized protein n=1 Tax=Mycena maculata TaxID=230809 RepID=A0AAD7HMX0_9AGAR|nr:hypothetical protein DFH07DRAFT_274704 [Mycena maculata]
MDNNGHSRSLVYSSLFNLTTIVSTTTFFIFPPPTSVRFERASTRFCRGHSEAMVSSFFWSRIPASMKVLISTGSGDGDDSEKSELDRRLTVALSPSQIITGVQIMDPITDALAIKLASSATAFRDPVLEVFFHIFQGELKSQFAGNFISKFRELFQ